MLEHVRTWAGSGGAPVSEKRVFWYDALGRRVLMMSPDTSAQGDDYGLWRYTWSASNQLVRSTQADPLADQDTNIAPPILFLPGTRPNELFGAIDGTRSGIEKLYIADAQGSVRKIVDDAGATGSLADYSAYGQERAPRTA